MKEFSCPQRFANVNAARIHRKPVVGTLRRGTLRAARHSQNITGLGPLETKYLRDKVTPVPGVRQFGVVPPLISQAGGEEMLRWLDSSPAVKTVHVSVGTMAPTRLRFGKSIIDAILRFGARVLWAAPQCPWGPETRYPPEKVRWEKWAPQPRVLAHPTVTAFVTHAGTGAIQEALWFAKPVVCIPLLWDQPYNAWVAQQLGFGVKLDKRRITSSAVHGALCDVHTTSFANAASALSAEIRSLSGGEQVTEYLATL